MELMRWSLPGLESPARLEHHVEIQWWCAAGAAGRLHDVILGVRPFAAIIEKKAVVREQFLIRFSCEARSAISLMGACRSTAGLRDRRAARHSVQSRNTALTASARLCTLSFRKMLQVSE
jgi:hypothetical protein